MKDLKYKVVVSISEGMTAGQQNRLRIVMSRKLNAMTDKIMSDNIQVMQSHWKEE